MGRRPGPSQGLENGKLHFRILCKRCNSYLFTRAFIARNAVQFECTKCNVTAEWDEEFSGV